MTSIEWLSRLKRIRKPTQAESCQVVHQISRSSPVTCCVLLGAHTIARQFRLLSSRFRTKLLSFVFVTIRESITGENPVHHAIWFHMMKLGLVRKLARAKKAVRSKTT